ncbi:MAG: SprB repeat-containing protein [Saprospiraceae bacterium]|nr:SprB repeat-containing protein [Saprospiraceae bacterium]
MTKCEFSKNFTIEGFGNLKLNISGTGFQTFCFNQSTQATLTVSASGGSGNYTYSWPGGTKIVTSSGSYSVSVTDNVSGCTKSKKGFVIFLPVICSRDPNDIIGPEGYSNSKMVPKFVQMPYMIRFENDPDFATAPAQVVKITGPLDSNLNILSLRLGDFGFAGFNYRCHLTEPFTVPGWITN